MNRPKVTVSHRYGYYASEEPAALDAKDIVQEARSTAAGRYDVDANDIGVTLAIKSISPGGLKTDPAGVTVDITVDLSAVPLEMVSGLRTGQFDVSVYCGDAKEKVVGQMQVRWNLRADVDTYAAWLKDGLTRTLTVPVSTRPKFVKVVVYDRQSDRVGSKILTIK